MSSGEAAGSLESLEVELVGKPGIPEGIIDRDEFQIDAGLMKQRLNVRSRGLIDPMSQFRVRWDNVMLYAIVYTAIVTPFEISLVESMDATNPTLIFNWITTALFLIDIVLNFCAPYHLPANRGGRLVRSHRLIAKRYLKSWLLFDLLAALPLGELNELLSALRLLRLARIFRLSRALKRLEFKVALSSSNKTGVFYVIVVLLTLHWLACLWAALDMYKGSIRTDELHTAVANRTAAEALAGRGVTCTGCTPTGAASGVDPLCIDKCLTDCEAELLAELNLENVAFVRNQENWMCRAGFAGTLSTRHHPDSMSSLWERWLFAMLVALAQICGGAVILAPQNVPEYITFFVAMLLGSVIWAIVQGVVCGVITTGDPHAIAHKQNMDALNFMMKDMDISPDLRMAVREYHRHTLQLTKRQSYTELISSNLSPKLSDSIYMQMGTWVVSRIWWLRKCSPAFTCDLFIRMSRAAIGARETIPADKLTVLCMGVVAVNGKIKTANDADPAVWGDILLKSKALRIHAPARALTYCEVATLTSEDLEATIAEHPDQAANLRQMALIESVERAAQMIAKAVQAQKKKKQYAQASEAQRREMDLQEGLQQALGGEEVQDISSSGADDILRKLASRSGSPWKEIDSDGRVVAEGDAAAEGAAAASPARPATKEELNRQQDERFKEDMGMSPTKAATPTPAMSFWPGQSRIESDVLEELKKVRKDALLSQALAMESQEKVNQTVATIAKTSQRLELRLSAIESMLSRGVSLVETDAPLRGSPTPKLTPKGEDKQPESGRAALSSSSGGPATTRTKVLNALSGVRARGREGPLMPQPRPLPPSPAFAGASPAPEALDA